MNRKTIAVLLGLALGGFALTPTMAQTPDGQTPANEGVCDDLKADGITKGLYGLCVAFCEGQDHASLSEPITQQELDALADAAPSGKILANYNKKKQPGDPDMPCIKVQEPCPCWTEEEFLTVTQAAVDEQGIATCSTNFFGTGELYFLFDNKPPQNMAYAWERLFEANGHRCQYFENLGDPAGIVRVFRITPEEFASCRDRIIARQNEFGLTPNSVSQQISQGYCLDQP